MLCPLDVARASDKTLARAKTRSVLLDALKTRSRTLGRPQKPPKPPEVVRLLSRERVASHLPIRAGYRRLGIKGGNRSTLATRSLRLVDGRPTNTELEDQTFDSGRLSERWGDVCLCRSSPRRASFGASSQSTGCARWCSDHRESLARVRSIFLFCYFALNASELKHRCNYVAMIACVNSVGAGEYSDVSEEAIATKAHGASSTKEGKHASPSSERMLDKKVVRARIAVREAREKRQRIADMMKAQAIAEREAAAAKRKMRQGDGGELER